LGQTGPEVSFLARTRRYNVFLAPTRASLRFGAARGGNSRQRTIAWQLLGANPYADSHPAPELPSHTNYITGNDPKRWRIGVPNYEEIGFSDVYPGIALRYHGDGSGHLESDFVVAPGADAASIRFRVLGADKIRLNRDGNLQIAAGDEHLQWKRPIVYQETGTGRRLIPAVYELRRNQVRFRVGAYDRSRPLIIDPVLIWSQFFNGGSAWGGIGGMTADHAGNLYLIGTTGSIDFPTLNAFEPKLPVWYTQKTSAFLMKLNAGGGVVFSTYFSGSSQDTGDAVAVDSSGAIYFAGTTTSDDLPTTPGAYQPRRNGLTDLYLGKFDSSGSSLAYLTYLGGSNNEERAGGLSVDQSGNVYIAATTNSDDFPVVNAPPHTPPAPGSFLPSGGVVAARLNPAGTGLLYSTYVSAVNWGLVTGAGIDANNNLYVSGFLGPRSILSPTPGALQTIRLNSDLDGFVIKLDPSGVVQYATYLGGSAGDQTSAMAVDAAGYAYVVGLGYSPDFPLQNAYQSSCRSVNALCTAAYIAKINPSGTGLVYSTFLGGLNNWLGTGSSYGGGDIPNAVAVDSQGNAFVVGLASDPQFPVMNPLQAQCVPDSTGKCSWDAFISQFDPAGSLMFSTYLGGSGIDSAGAVAVDNNGNIFVAGETNSSNFPILHSTSTYRSGGTNFLLKLSNAPPAPGISVSPSSLNFGNQAINVASPARTMTISSSGNTPLGISSISATGDFTQTNNCPSSLDLGNACTANISFVPSALGGRSGSLVVFDNAAGNPHSYSLSGTGVIAPDIRISPASLSFGAQQLNTTSAAQMITVSNPTTTTLTISAINIAGDFGRTTTCVAALAGGSSCTISVTFTPTGGGTRTGAITIASSAASGTQVIPLTGVCLTPALSVFPSAPAFPATKVGTISLPSRLTITSTGNQALVITQITIYGSNASNFTQATSCLAAPVQPGATCSIDVSFAPSFDGVATAWIRITSNAPPIPDISLTGMGYGPAISVTGNVNFPATVVGTTAGPQTLTVNSVGHLPLSIFSIVLGNADFSQTNNCPAALAVGLSCAIQVTFTPDATGGTSRTLQGTIRSNDGINPNLGIGVGGTVTFLPLSGDPTTLTFAPFPNTLNQRLYVHLTNTTNGQVTLSTPTITGANATDFQLATSDCATILQATGNCYLGLSFYTQDLTAGARTATLSVPYSGATGSPLKVTLNGSVATVPQVSFDKPGVGFGVQDLNSPPVAQVVTLSSVGGATLHISGIVATPPFSQTSNCPTALAAGSSCAINVSFNPTSYNFVGGQLTVSDDAGNSPQNLPLTGQGGRPLAVISSLSPAGAGAGHPGFLLNVAGTYFQPDSIIRWNGSDRHTVFLNDSQLLAFINAGDVATAGSQTVTVFTPPLGGGTSAGVTFTVQANTPPIGALEKAVNTADNTNVLPQGSTLQASGWAADNEDGAPVAKVSVKVVPAGVTGVSGTYISDSGNNVVRWVDSFGTIITVAGNGTAGYSGDGGQATNAKLNQPKKVLVDGSGNFYIADWLNNRIRRVDAASHVITTVASVGGATWGLALDSGNTNLYFSWGQRVWKVTFANSTTSAVAGMVTSLCGFTGDGGLATSANLCNPTGIAFDNNGNLLIADTGNQRIRRVDATTQYISTIVGTGNTAYNGDGIAATSANLSSPFGVAVDRSNNIYIADFGNNRVRKVDAQSNLISTVAGNGTKGYTGDGGLATNAEIAQPRDVALDAAGNLYIADYGNNVIRRVDAGTNIITTIAGAGAAGYTGDLGPATSATFQQIEGVSLNGSTMVPPMGFVSADATLGGQRPDIATKYSRPDYLNSGWSANVTIPGLSPGGYSVLATAHDSVGATTTFPPLNVSITPGTFANASLATSLNFGTVLLGSYSPARALMLQNTGNGPLSISNVQITGNFTQTNNCGSLVAARASCSFNISYHPTSFSLQTGTLALTDNSVGSSTQTVSLLGAGGDLSISLIRPARPTRAAAGSAASIVPGQLLTIPIRVNASAGLEGTVHFSCRTADALQCSVTPAVLVLPSRQTAARLEVRVKPAARNRRLHAAALGRYTVTVAAELDGLVREATTVVEVMGRRPLRLSQPR